MGGRSNAIEFIMKEIDESAWGYAERYRTGQDIVVGVNKYVEDDIEVPRTSCASTRRASTSRSRG